MMIAAPRCKLTVQKKSMCFAVECSGPILVILATEMIRMAKVVAAKIGIAIVGNPVISLMIGKA